MSKHEEDLNRIKRTIKEMQEHASAEEILMEVSQILPPRVVHVAPEPKNSPKQLEYMREWRKDRKKLKEFELKANKKEAVNKLKIDKGLLRENMFCFQCKENIKVDSSKNQYTIETKRGQIKRKLIISNECPKCSTKLRAFGGILAL